MTDKETIEALEGENIYLKGCVAKLEQDNKNLVQILAEIRVNIQNVLALLSGKR